MANHNFYGDNINRYFFGVVVHNNDDILNLGRVQIRIHGIHGPNIKNRDLPWAQILLPNTEPGANGVGQNPMIGVGAQVFGIFLDGTESQVPLVLGTVPRTEIPSVQQQNVQKQSTSPRPKLRPAGLSTILPDSSDLIGGSNAEKIFNFLVGKGFSQEVAAGFVGNFMVEVTASLDPNTLNPNDKGKPAFGLAQWRDDRYVNLVNWSTENGGDYKALNAQLGFLLFELTTYERRAYNKIVKSKNTAEAARNIDIYFERSDGSKRETRVKNAKEVFIRFAK